MHNSYIAIQSLHTNHDMRMFVFNAEPSNLAALGIEAPLTAANVLRCSMAGLSSPSVEASKHRPPCQASSRYYKIQRNLRTPPTWWCQVALGPKDEPRRRRLSKLEGMEAAVDAAVQALLVAAVEGMEGCVLVDP
jgi:hypothetical protein